MTIIVATSTVADGSMYNRHDREDATVFDHLTSFVAGQSITPQQTTRFNPLYDFETNDFCRYSSVGPEAKGMGMTKNDGIYADALFTDDKNHALLLPVADCVAAVLYDSERHVLGVAHLGRHSLEQNGGSKIISFMKETYGSDAKNIMVWLSPAPSKEIYPIWVLDNKGMKEATFEQLKNAGIIKENIINNPIETDKDDRYYSYSEFLKGHRSEDGDYAVVAMIQA